MNKIELSGDVSEKQPVVHAVFGDNEVPPDQPTVTEKVKTLLVGRPFDLADKQVYHHISLVALLAWTFSLAMRVSQQLPMQMPSFSPAVDSRAIRR